ncbi:nuclear localization sequence-binding protein isoform X2 [Denticeps clupeoides]|nr:NADH dehydrogenase [ubiquinone] flavoprotein 3, mitochondrial isoform X2 [Denticeps clupeoides]
MLAFMGRESLLANKTAVIFPTKVRTEDVLTVTQDSPVTSFTAPVEAACSEALSEKETMPTEPSAPHVTADGVTRSPDAADKTQASTEEISTSSSDSDSDSDSDEERGEEKDESGQYDTSITETPSPSGYYTKAQAKPAKARIVAQDKSTEAEFASAVGVETVVGTTNETTPNKPRPEELSEQVKAAFVSKAKCKTMSEAAAEDTAVTDVDKGSVATPEATTDKTAPEAVVMSEAEGVEKTGGYSTVQNPVDQPPVLSEPGGEELSALDEVSPLPPEPVDFSTYKNLQHHHYNIYTFADLDVEMAKYRLPQPSSGRPSPRH